MKKQARERCLLPSPAKALSLPVMTIAPMSPSVSNLSKAWPTSFISPSHKALRALGRFNWMKPTLFFSPRFSTKIYSYWPPVCRENQHQWTDKTFVHEQRVSAGFTDVHFRLFWTTTQNTGLTALLTKVWKYDGKPAGTLCPWIIIIRHAFSITEHLLIELRLPTWKSRRKGIDGLKTKIKRLIY